MTTPPPAGTTPAGTTPGRSNDVTERDRIWQRFAGDDWTCFDALPLALRQRLREHAYDAWAVNAWTAWRTERRRLGTVRAQRRLLRWLDECERLEREAFAESYRRRYQAALPHDAARATVLRYLQPGSPSVPAPPAGAGGPTPPRPPVSPHTPRTATGSPP